MRLMIDRADAINAASRHVKSPMAEWGNLEAAPRVAHVTAHEISADLKDLPVEPVVMICNSCGSDMTDEELAELRKSKPVSLSCCPERKMRPVTRADWVRLRNALERKIRDYRAIRTGLRTKVLPEPKVLKVLGQFADFPADNERGKRLRREHVSAAIPYKSECEGGAGLWARLNAPQPAVKPLVDAAKALCDRWDTSDWGGSTDNIRHTGEYISDLRKALGAVEGGGA